MHLTFTDSIAQVPASSWNALNTTEYPFLRHEFLLALEQTGCVSAQSGWTPQHALVHENANATGPLLAVAPLYVKAHSYGEYVFDWAWANAYARAHLRYYPKLVAAVPFTPATGPRMLTALGPDRHRLTSLLIEGARARAEALGASSVHWLFTTEEETERLERHAYLKRVGCQFHWENQGYQNFDDFLGNFSAQKRKKIKRERRYVEDADVQMEVVTGAAISETHWRAFYQFYRSTIGKHGAIAYLNADFFREIGRTLADRLVLILAQHQGEYVAGALNVRGPETLYGRYWGSTDAFHSLHFETCYYRAIEYCIEHGLKRFEAGAQGEHKLSRGFLPAAVYSAHWLSHREFNNVVADFLAREQNGMEHYMNELNEHTPFKKECQ